MCTFSKSLSSAANAASAVSKACGKREPCRASAQRPDAPSRKMPVVPKPDSAGCGTAGTNQRCSMRSSTECSTGSS